MNYLRSSKEMIIKLIMHELDLNNELKLTEVIELEKLL